MYDLFKKRIMGSAIGKFIVMTFFPFLIPFIMDIPDEWMIFKLKLCILFILIILNFLLSYKIIKYTEDEASESFSDRARRNAFSNAYNLIYEKKRLLSKRSYDNASGIPVVAFPYSVFDHIESICLELVRIVSELTEIEEEHISVNFIYHYAYSGVEPDGRKWKWIVGKDTDANIEKMIEKENSAYHSLIYGIQNNTLKSEYREKIFSLKANDKSKLADQKQYFFSSRDKAHGCRGSFFGRKILFVNNCDTFVESILIISTYGKCFLDIIGNDCNESAFWNVLEEDIFPYFERLIEYELGLLYLRHREKLNNKSAQEPLKIENKQNK